MDIFRPDWAGAVEAIVKRSNVTSSGSFQADAEDDKALSFNCPCGSMLNGVPNTFEACHMASRFSDDLRDIALRKARPTNKSLLPKELSGMHSVINSETLTITQSIYRDMVC